ncbi:MAG: glycoside hydrolase N-terminal domain-containing protein, partial [Verrucomicrobiales bacterium]
MQARTFLRRLDLQTASVEVSYRDGRVRHRREYFASHPDRVLVGRLRAVKKKSLNLTLSWDSPHQQAKIRYDKESNR